MMGARNYIEFKIPFAENSIGDLVPARDANRDDNEYFCPNCDGTVILKAGTIRKTHFAHKSVLDCSPESYEHKLSKITLKEYLIRGDVIQLNLARDCSCNLLKSWRMVPLQIKEGDRIVLEYTDDNSLRYDLAILNNDRVRLAIEICHTNKVSIDKQNKLGNIPMIELSSKEIVQQREKPNMQLSVNTAFNLIPLKKCPHGNTNRNAPPDDSIIKELTMKLVEMEKRESILQKQGYHYHLENEICHRGHKHDYLNY